MNNGAKVISILLVLCLALFCAGCKTDKSISEEAKKTEDVTIGFYGDVDSWDPCTGFGSTGPIIFSTLMEMNGDNKLVNDLATEHQVSGDALIWTFKIRDDVYFTDGEKLTAKDVAFTYTTTKNSKSFVDLTMLDTVTALDDTTVEFKLNKPTSTFIITTSEIGIVPEHAYNENFGQDPIGSGPYKLAQWDKGQQFILEANDKYYGQKPAIKRVVFLNIQDEDARFVAATSGQVDIAITSATIAVNEIPGMKVQRVKSVDNRGITLPVVPDEGKLTEDGNKIGNNVTSDIAIRKALCYGIDRQQIIDEALNGLAGPAYTECDGLAWWNPETVIETDVEYACSLLDEAGWVAKDSSGIREKNGQQAAFTCMYFAGDSMRQAVALSTANQAKEKLGIDITVEGVSGEETAKRMFSDPMIMGWGSSNPITSYMLFHSSNVGRPDFYNPENFRNETVDGYLDAALNSKSLDESIEHWKKAQWDGTTGTSMKGEAPWVFLINMDHVYFVKDGLDIGKQKLHAHGAAWPLVANLKEWKWN